ncbi:hypothetical protein [Cupriavidus sp. L7L]|uniref:hypothetical protein n=1 Tax=Cupriavidus sp. L7L TaxID=2546443 RepID=UPI0014048BD2
MRIILQLVVQDDGDVPAIVTEIAQFERDGLDVGSVGLHLEEAKSLLGLLQRTMVTAQVAEVVARTSVCPTCGAQLTVRGCTRAGSARVTLASCVIPLARYAAEGYLRRNPHKKRVLHRSPGKAARIFRVK